MKELIELPTKEKEHVVFKPLVKHQVSTSAEILRIENDPNFTRIDFIVYASPIYVNGGWVQMYSQSFIRPVGSNLCLTLVKAVNIPIAPTKHFFKGKKDFLCYTLVFPALPEGTKSIDIIEKEIPGDNTWFNFYGVSMDKVKSERLVVSN
jgi:hypothetical protein